MSTIGNPRRLVFYEAMYWVRVGENGLGVPESEVTYLHAASVEVFDNEKMQPTVKICYAGKFLRPHVRRRLRYAMSHGP